MDVVRALVSGLHLGLAAVWLGSMVYSLVVVQPRALRLLGAQRYEEFAAVVAAGARWSVLAVLAGLGLTGVVLVWLVVDRDVGGGWWIVVAAKTALLLVSLGLFVVVSWRLWPRRIFALPDEIAGLRREFRIAGSALLATVVAQFILGGLASIL